MLFVGDRGHGETVDVMTGVRIDSEAMRRERATEMLRRRLQGWNNAQIARFLGCTDRWVRFELAEMDPAEKARIIGEYRKQARVLELFARLTDVAQRNDDIEAFDSDDLIDLIRREVNDAPSEISVAV